MIFQTTDPVKVKQFVTSYFYISATGGDLTIERTTEDPANGPLVEVDGSPLLDGEEKVILTFSADRHLTLTPSVAGMEAQYEAIND